MKLSLSVALISTTSVTQAVLGPGYEDYHWCPPGSCEIYINLYGYTGPASLFNKCFNTTTGTFSNGVWTGDKTNVTVPEGWEQPPECTAEQYSQCDTAADCALKVGPGCSCYVSSTIFPFDASQYRESTCTGNECEGYIAECVPGVGGLGNTCMLKFDLMPIAPVGNETTVDTNATDTPSSTDGEGGDSMTDTAATTPAGGDGDGTKEGETIPVNTGGSEQPPADSVPDDSSSGNVIVASGVSISMFVVAAAVFSYLS